MTQQRAAAIRSGRLKLLALAAVFLVPVAAAVGWYFVAPSLAPPPSVHGTLIDPARPLDPFELPRAGDEPYTLDAMRGRWTLVHVVGARCDATCRERVYYTRQIRDALGEDRIRVQRLAVAARGRATAGLADILAEHPRLTVLEAGPGDPLADQLPADPASGTVFVIDPLGNLMLRFDPGVEPDHILEDLERVLKLSRIG